MEEKNQGEVSRQEGRSDYGESKGNYSSSTGRVLRPRRKRISDGGSAGHSNYEKVTYNTEDSGESRGNYGERRSSYGEHRSSYGEHRSSYGEHRSSYGEHRSSYGDRSGSGERRSYGSGSSSYGERRSSYGDRSGSGERRSYGSGSSSYGERRSSYGDRSGSGERRSYGSGSSSYGERRSSYGDRSGSGERRSYGSGSSSYGEHRSSYGDRSGSGERRSYGSGSSSYGEHRSSVGGRGGSSDRRGRSSDGEHRGGFGGRSNDRGGFGGRGGYRGQSDSRYPKREEIQFNEADEAGINQMLSKKAAIDNAAAMSDNDTVKTPIQEEVRLNKYIANSGICSRREADNYIQAGVVTVNGEVVTELGTKINILKDEIKFNGETLKGEEKVYLVMNKPKGFVTTASDPHADRTVMDLLSGCDTRVFPVGRLDKNTTGVLMFTNDGEMAERLTHPSYNKKKIYQVILDNPLSQEDHDKIIAGITLTDGDVKADELEFIDAEDHRKLGIEIHSGKNRIVRRIFESCGYDVKALDRVYFAGLTKKGLKRGEWRFLTEGEVNILKMCAYV